MGGDEDGLSEDLPPNVPGERTMVETNGIRLHCVEAGPEEGPLMVLLHGFPEFWYGWHEAIAPLTSEGYRVVVPDQRGYNRSDKPPRVADYHLDQLAGDVVGIIDHYGHEDARVVGHDWGGLVGWWLAMHRPNRLSHLVTVNAPHPGVYMETIRRSWSQRVKSSYALGFQVPWLPEFVARRGDWAILVRGMRRSSNPGTFGPEEFDRYRAAWERDDAFSSMLDWYRAFGRDRPEPADGTITVPTTVIWGAGEQFLNRSMARRSTNRCEEGYLCTIDDGSHWVQHEFPARVAKEIHEHVAPPSMTAPP